MQALCCWPGTPCILNHISLFLRVLTVQQELAARFSCMYAINPDTSASDCNVSLAFLCPLHNFSLILHMMCSTCSEMLLCNLRYAAAGWVQMACHRQLTHMATLAVGVDTISKQCSASRCTL